MKEWWKDYFSFTKKERTGAIVLSILIVAIFIAPIFFEQHFNRLTEEELVLVKTGMIKSAVKDSTDKETNESFISRKKYPADEPLNQEKLFHFDPNTLSDEGWKKLGVKEKTIQTIRHYFDKGGKFHNPGDLKRIYGLRPGQAERLIPYVVIKNPAIVNGYDKQETNFNRKNSLQTTNAYKDAYKTPVDINLADTAEWIALPGIGSRLATRIVYFRQKLGGFYSVDQVGETFGLADSVFQKIKDRLLISTQHLKQIDVNNASLEELRQHPYIRWNIAQAIVRYREQHGAFKSIDDIAQINIISNDLLLKLKPYLTTY